MKPAKRLLPLLFLTIALGTAGCAAQQAVSTTGAVTTTTASTADSVLEGIGTVILYPFRLIWDVLL